MNSIFKTTPTPDGVTVSGYRIFFIKLVYRKRKSASGQVLVEEYFRFPRSGRGWLSSIRIIARILVHPCALHISRYSSHYSVNICAAHRFLWITKIKNFTPFSRIQTKSQSLYSVILIYMPSSAIMYNHSKTDTNELRFSWRLSAVE